MRRLLLAILMTGTLAGCVVYDGPYRAHPRAYVYGPAYGYAPGYRDYGYHRGPGCWHCRW